MFYNVYIMAIEVKRKNNESTYSLLRRFQDRIKKGRVLNLAKKGMYFEKKPNKRLIQESALRRKENREKRDYLIRVGKITEDTLGGPNKFSKK